MPCGDGVGKLAAEVWCGVRCGAAIQACSMGLRKGALAAQGCSVATGRGAACRRARAAAWCCTGALPGAVLGRSGRARGVACGCPGA